MTKPVKKEALITGILEISSGIFSMWLKEEEIAKVAKSGQFLSVYCKDKSKLLPRPISICEIDKKEGLLRLVFRVVGKGTLELSTYQVSETLDVLGPLGNGFYFDNKQDNCEIEGEFNSLSQGDINSKFNLLNLKQAILIGGGIGIPPMLELAKQLTCKKTIILGYRDSNTFLLEEFKNYGEVVISTEDGSIGIKGNVIDAIKENQVMGDMIFACGPTPMLKGVKAFAKEAGILAQISVEERMACGIGACLACVCKSKEIDKHSNVNNKRVCKDGPVFFAEEIEL